MIIKSFNRFNESLTDPIFTDEIPHYGEVFTISEFKEQIKDGDITKVDGIGYYSDGLHMSRKHPVFSAEEPNGSLYVIWFSK
jgi:hypothetical protein